MNIKTLLVLIHSIFFIWNHYEPFTVISLFKAERTQYFTHQDPKPTLGPILSHVSPCPLNTNRNKTWREDLTHLMSLILHGSSDSSSTGIAVLSLWWRYVTHRAHFGLWWDVESGAAGVVSLQGILRLKQGPLWISARWIRLGQHVHRNTFGQCGIRHTEGLISPPETFNFTLLNLSMVWFS